MPITRGATRGLAVLPFLFVLAFTLAGCELIVEEPQQRAREEAQHTILSMAVTQLPDYDVAVSAIDFEPPLARGALLKPNGAVKLLAAVENKGTMPLTSLAVEARVSSQKGEFSAQDRVLIEKLAPGETKLAEFEGVVPVTTLPRSPSYSVRVAVQSRQPDANPTNNSREVIVRVSD